MPTSTAKNGYQKNETYTVVTQSMVNSQITPNMTSAGVCINGNVLFQGTSGADLILQPGLYVFTGDVNLGNYMTATGVTFDLNTGNLGVTSTTNVNLEAPCVSTDLSGTTPTACAPPANGAINGILFAAPWANTTQWTIQWGAAGGGGSTCQTLTATSAAGLEFDGVIDAPGITLNMQDAGGYALISGLVVGALDQQTGSICVTNYASEHDGSPLSSITLVE